MTSLTLHRPLLVEITILRFANNFSPMEYLYSPLDQRKTLKDNHLPQTHTNKFPGLFTESVGSSESKETVWIFFVHVYLTEDGKGTFFNDSKHVLCVENNQFVHNKMWKLVRIKWSCHCPGKNTGKNAALFKASCNLFVIKRTINYTFQQFRRL